MLRVTDIKLPIDYTNENLEKAVEKRVGTKVNNIKIIKKSIDARDKKKVYFVFSVYCEPVGTYIKSTSISEITIKNIEIKQINTQKKVYVIGSGPAGLFAGLVLAKSGMKPIIVERGKQIDDRIKDVNKLFDSGILNTESNVLFGEGGAGTFSDGKLTTNISSDKINYVLKTFVENGAQEEILYDAKPHIGTDVLVNVVKNIRKTIENLGGKFLFQTKLNDINVSDRIHIFLNNEEHIADELILAIGHSARDTYEMLYKRNIEMAQKPFSMGVRLEQKQSIINESQYGEYANVLENATYKLSCHLPNGRGVYTFCMCPGGVVVPAMSEENMINVNGMSYAKRDLENANSAILVSVEPTDFSSNHPLAGIEFQRKYEKLAYGLTNSYYAPAMRVGSLYNRDKQGVTPSYRPGVNFVNLADCLPDFVFSSIKQALPIFNKKIRNFATDDAILIGIEARSSSPVRVLRDERYETNIKHIYPIGEGAGYAGGITSAAVDGINVALSIIERNDE